MNNHSHRFAMFMNVYHKQAVVVGGGGVALRKIKRLLDAGAKVLVIAPELHTSVAKLVQSGQIEHQPAAYSTEQLHQAAIIIAATNDAATNLEVATFAQAQGIPVNVVDQPMAGSFIMPSLVDRSPLLIAVSSGGASPVLARLLTARIEAFVPRSYGKLATLAAKYRDQVKTTFSNWQQRRRFWEQQLSTRVGELMLQNREADAETALQHALSQYQNHATQETEGEVYLVGAGPGDPDLLTFKALRLMQQADVIFYDALVSEAIMGLVKKDAECIYVGKRRSNHAMPQQSINEQLLEHAQAGKRVLRLKGGDPFIFGRGGEEIETLAAHGVAFQVVPGITAAAGCASFAGIPLTHRDHAQSCLFVTGHLKNDIVELNWSALTQPQQTVVIYMGLVGLPHICKQLIAHNMQPSTPIALVSQGTTQHQVVVVGTLENIAEKVQDSQVKAPTLIIIGSVVNLHETLKWFTPSPSNSQFV